MDRHVQAHRPTPDPGEPLTAGKASADSTPRAASARASRRGKKMEAAFRKHEDWIRASMEVLPEGFVIFSAVREKRRIVDFRYMYVNEASCRMIRRGRDELLGRTLLELFPSSRETEWFAGFVRTMETGEPYVMEAARSPKPLAGRNDPRGSYDVRAAKIEDGLAVSWADATERRRIEEDLASARRHLDTLIRNSPIAMIETDAMLNIVRWNREAERMLGWTAEEMVGGGPDSFPWVLEEDRESARAFAEELVDGKRPYSVHVSRNRRRDGSVILCEWHYSTIYDDRGRVSSFLAQALDVTERQRAEDALREEKKKYHRLFDQSPLGAALLSPDFRFLEVNQRVCEILGYSPEELSSLTFVDFTHPEDLETDLAQARRIRDGGIDQYDLEKRFLRKDGAVIWVRVNVRGIRDEAGRLLCFLPVIEDITDRKRMQDALAAARQHLDITLDGSPLPIVETDAQARVVRWNKEAERIFGWTAEETIGKTIFEIPWLHAGDVDTARGIREELVGRKQPRVVRAVRNLRKDGTVILCQWHVSPIRDAAGRIHSLVAHAIDITERERMVETLRASEETARQRLMVIEAIYDTARVGLCLIDTGMRCVRVNKRFAEMSGKPVAEHIWRSLGELVPDLKEPMDAMLRQVVETGKPLLDAEITGETPTRPGAKRTWVTQLVPMKNDRGEVIGVNIVAEDITDRAAAQEALLGLVAEKDILLRELSHRTKNNMQVIVGLLALQMSKSEDAHLSAALENAQHRIRAMALVHEKLYQSGSVSTLNMKEYLKDLVGSLLKAHQGVRGRVSATLELEEIHLSLDEALPCGLIVNELVSNSLKHAFRERRGGSIRLSLWREGAEARLLYGDDGPGLPAGLELSKVDSLGLKLVYNLAVRQLRGTMTLTQEPPAEFSFRFPLRLPPGAAERRGQ